jgi:hypothetical protein
VDAGKTKDLVESKLDLHLKDHTPARWVELASANEFDGPFIALVIDGSTSAFSIKDDRPGPTTMVHRPCSERGSRR